MNRSGTVGHIWAQPGRVPAAMPWNAFSDDELLDEEPDTTHSQELEVQAPEVPQELEVQTPDVQQAWTPPKEAPTPTPTPTHHTHKHDFHPP